MKGIKEIRLKAYNYSSNGYYFITICSHKRKPFFNEEFLRNLAENHLKTLKGINGVYLDQYVVMPNHLHIIFELNGCRLKIGEIVRRFKAGISRQITEKIWQPNYYEYVIRSDKALKKIREYILNNPTVAEIDFEQFYSTDNKNPKSKELDKSSNYN